MDLKLEGKRAFVSGASRGLGFATARGLVNEGCLVAINSRNQENLNASAAQLSNETGSQVLPLAAMSRKECQKSHPADRRVAWG
jgi:NAD(P)-dependent dehydrogenase (short-subunit alcohol dehydrogenase family)